MTSKGCQLPPSSPPDPYAVRGRELETYIMAELVYGADGLNPEPHLEAIRGGAPCTAHILWD